MENYSYESCSSVVFSLMRLVWQLWYKYGVGREVPSKLDIARLFLHIFIIIIYYYAYCCVYLLPFPLFQAELAGYNSNDQAEQFIK